jgi:hypothetical protein
LHFSTLYWEVIAGAAFLWEIPHSLGCRRFTAHNEIAFKATTIAALLACEKNEQLVLNRTASEIYFGYAEITARGHHGLCDLGGDIRGELSGRQPSPFAAVLKMGVNPDRFNAAFG